MGHHELQDVVADGDVEAGHRLVGDDHVGLEHDRAGDADALALAAGELVGVAVQVVAGGSQPGLLQGAHDALRELDHLLVGGDALGLALGAARIEAAARRRV